MQKKKDSKKTIFISCDQRDSCKYFMWGDKIIPEYNWE